MLSDRDIRLIRPSVAIDSDEKAAFRIRPIAVQKAMVFFPVTVRPEDSLERAAELMLRWKVGGLPVASDGDTLVGIITYTDLLRAFVAKKKAGAIA